MSNSRTQKITAQKDYIMKENLRNMVHCGFNIYMHKDVLGKEIRANGEKAMLK